MDANTRATLEALPAVNVEVNGQAAALLIKLMGDIGTEQPMAVLTPVQRSALVLVTVVGLDYDAAAVALETTPGAVRAAVSRARGILVES